MKTLILSAALTLAASQWAVAADFAYERQIASEDLASETSGLVYAARDPQPSGREFRTSLDAVIEDNPDSSDSLPAGTMLRQSDRCACLPTSYDIMAAGNPDLVS